MARATPERRAIPAWVPPLVIALLTFLAFLPVLHNGFVSWDDRANFVENPHYRGLGPTQLAWMWTTFRLGHYVPLTWMTLGFDYTLWGMNPAGYHLTNLLLHCVDAVLVYWLSLRVFELVGGTDQQPVASSQKQAASFQLAAGFSALFFAVHPLRVESVAWVTERRDVLSMLFYLCTLLAYLRWTRTGARRWYWASVGLFLCALLSKATAMTLPAVLALFNVYPLRRVGPTQGWWSESSRRVYAELAPFAALSAASIVLSIVALHPPGQLGLGAKAAVSAYSLAFYVIKTIAPTNLAPLYEMPQHVLPFDGIYIASYAAAIILTAAAIAVRKRWPAVTLSWIAFLLVSLPMLGVVQNGPQIAADRYTYHAAPALGMLLGAAIFLTGDENSYALARRGFAVVVLGVLGLVTWWQSEIWHDSETLWTRVLDVDSESSIAHSAMASLLFQQNRVADAITHSERAVALAPDFAEAHNDLGVGFARQGKFDEAAAEYRRALAIKPAYDEAHNNLGVVIARQGDANDAVREYREALSINPDLSDAQVNWGNVLDRAGDQAGAIHHYEAAVAIRPDHADAHFNWGVALAQQGRMAEAIDHFRQALAIDPNNAGAKEYLEQATQQLNARPR